jgi:hydroxypyruvate isomerase
MKLPQNRRQAIKNIVTGTGAIVAGVGLSSFKSSAPQSYKLKGNINHSVCRWCFRDIPLDKFCAEAKAMGMKGIDLVGPDEWPTLQKYGLYSSMCNGAEINIPKGWNDRQYHPTLIDNYTDMIPKVAAAGYKNLICFSGNRNGIDDETGLAICTEGLKKILPLAEKHGVVLCMELLNSKITHKDYQCDRTSWGVALAKRLGSENFKLLYDIFHMQVDEGDVIATIRANHQYIAHYHVAGVPGRHEPDSTQELYYPAIIKAIKDIGFKGYVAQEYISVATTQDKQIASLKEAIKICDV